MTGEQRQPYRVEVRRMTDEEIVAEIAWKAPEHDSDPERIPVAIPEDLEGDDLWPGDVLYDLPDDAAPLDDFSTWTSYATVGPLPTPDEHDEWETRWHVNPHTITVADGAVHLSQPRLTRVADPRALALALLAAEAKTLPATDRAVDGADTEETP